MTQDDAIRALERPHPSLLTYYALGSLMLGPFFPVALVPLYFRYHTMRYRFDDDGISMRWGILFRKEVHLTYSRIQDIHLVSNFVERWLDLARIQIQTASGSSKAEMTIEGLKEFEALRDFIYQRMRGARGRPSPAREAPVSSESRHEDGELAAILRDVAKELRTIRERMDRRGDGDV